MISRSTRLFVFVAVLLAAIGATGLLHLETARLSREASVRNQQLRKLAGLRAANRELASAAAAIDSAASTDVRQQIDATRVEIAALERAAEQRHAEREARDGAAKSALDANRNPRLGMMRVEYFEAKGSGTPLDTLQTMIHAAYTGDDATLLRLIELPPAERAQAEQLVARLPADTRASWSPENLAVLWVSRALADVSALQITGETYLSPQQAVVTFRLPGEDKDQRVTLTSGNDGWRAVLPAGAMEKLVRQMERGL